METTLQISHTAGKRQDDLTTFRKAVIQDLLQVIACFLGAVFAVYYAPSYVNFLYFLVLMGLFWRSKHNYF